MEYEFVALTSSQITENGDYTGSLLGTERVRLIKPELTVALNDVESVMGSRGDDFVTMVGTSSTGVSDVNLRGGNDVLHLAGGQDHVIRLRGVESITSEPDATLTVVGNAKFRTDGSFSIAAQDARKGALEIEFTDISDDISLSLGTGKNVVTFGAGFEFSANRNGELVVSKSGHELTFTEIDPASRAVTIIQDGVARSYADVYGKALKDVGPVVTELTSSHPEGVYEDDDRTVTFSVKFSEPVSALAASDLYIDDAELVSGPTLSADGLSATFTVQAPLGSNSEITVVLLDTIKDVDGNALEIAYLNVPVDLAGPVFYGLWADVPQSRATNADSVVFSGQFSKPVGEISAEDFVLTGTTATITSITTVVGHQFTELSIVVSGGDLAGLNGSVTLAFAAQQDIADEQGRTLVSSHMEPVTLVFDNAPPQINVTNAVSLESLTQFAGIGIQGTGFREEGGMDVSRFDWSKIWISVDDAGANISLALSDLAAVSYGSDFIGFGLSEAKMQEIRARVDGSGDRFVIEPGFWSDGAGNVQIVGGGIDIAAPVF